MNDLEYKSKRYEYFKKEGYIIIYCAAFICLGFIIYSYYSFYRLSKFKKI